MIGNRLIKHLSILPPCLTRFSSNQATTSSPRMDGNNSNTAPIASMQQMVKQEPRDDDLYRYLFIKCRGHEIQVLDSYERFLKMAADHLGINHVKTEAPFRIIKRKTMLACRFVKKKYRVQYEVRTYHRDVLFKNLTGSTADTFLEYIERNLPEGVMMIAEKHRLAKLPFDLEADKDKTQTIVENKSS